ncbi:N-acetyltransferase [Silvibacterium dinghuense]|uniref:N-acetyltransferase n=2 Tax=Silvibacterium dinghuense TaxID=1560006 RepID=A0A4Q1SK57_9BACT|nr:N-acetyltransferase [Silvibacterium dinghuense]
MAVAPATLTGKHVQLEPMTMEHFEALSEVAFDPAIWRWMPLRVENPADLRSWMNQAIEQAAAGKALPWVTRSLADGRLVGSTRFLDIDTRNRGLEIGSTWISAQYQRTGINVEAKLLQLTHAFETMGAIRVALKTHHENQRSQTAIAALGATREGVFRNHMIQPDGSIRHTVWFSITREDWPEVKQRLEARLAGGRAVAAS